MLNAIAAAAAALMVFPAPAHTSAPVDWQASTCAAAAAYGKHPTTAGLAKVVTDATHLGRSWIAADVGALFSDAMSPSKKAAPFVRDDVKYIAWDCLKVVSG